MKRYNVEVTFTQTVTRTVRGNVSRNALVEIDGKLTLSEGALQQMLHADHLPIVLETEGGRTLHSVSLPALVEG